jgi:hypothetical protein
MMKETGMMTVAGHGLPEGNPMSAPKTIMEAQAWYAKESDDPVCTSYGAALDALIKAGASFTVSNHNYRDALFLTDAMLRNAKKHVRALTGPGGDGFFRCLRKTVEGTLERLHRNEGRMRIIVLDDASSPDLADLKNRYNNTLHVIHAKTREESSVAHLLAVDSKMIRQEKPHGPIRPDTPEGEIQADVFFNNRAEAAVAEERFDGIWDYLSK